MSLNHQSRIVISLVVLLSAQVYGYTTEISFDCLVPCDVEFPPADGTPISTEYASLGAVFASNDNAPAQIFHRLNTPQEATSAPNILTGSDKYSDIFVRFVDPATGLPVSADAASVWVISAGWNQLTVKSRNTFGQPLQTFTVQHIEAGDPENGFTNQDELVFSEPGIATIEFVFTVDVHVDGIGIDDLSFDISCPRPGDLNCDGLVDGQDIGEFVQCYLLSAEVAPGCGAADIDQNLLLEELDLLQFVDLVID